MFDDDKKVPENSGKYVHNVNDSDEVNTDIIDSIPKSVTSYGIPHTHTIIVNKFLLKPVPEALLINLFSVIPKRYTIQVRVSSTRCFRVDCCVISKVVQQSGNVKPCMK